MENAIVLTMALVGIDERYSSLTGYRSCGRCDLTIEDFNDIQEKVPHLADLKPSGKYVFQDLYEVGGVPAVLKYLYDNGYIHGDCLTVTGKTIAENLEKR